MGGARAGSSLRRLARGMADAEAFVADWCSWVREEAEVRVGVGAGDDAVLDDVEYAAALDVYAAVCAAAARVRSAETQ